MKNYIIFDFETTGIGSFLSQKPIQLAWLLMDENKTIIRKESYYIKGNTELNTEFHKNLSLEFLETNGYDLEYVLKDFMTDVDKIIGIEDSGKIIAHNISFDTRILFNSIKKCHMNVDEKAFIDKSFCTMKRSKDLCKISKGDYYKYPKLIELYTFLFQKYPLDILHEASADIKVLYECVCKLDEKYENYLF